MSRGYSAVPRLVVDGRALDRLVEADIARVEVDEREGLPTMLTVMLRDARRDVLDRSGITVGTRVEVEAGSVGQSVTVVLVDAEVVTVEASYTGRASTVTVRGHDLSHRLHRVRRTRSWNEVTDGDVVRRVAEDAGLDVGEVDDPGVVHAHLSQLDASDWDFVSARARESGRLLQVRHGRLELVAHEQASAAPEPGRLTEDRAGRLVLGTTLESLEARVTASGLPTDVEVRGWGAATKQAVAGSARVAAPGVDIGADPAGVAAGAAVQVVADRAVATQEEADALAGSLAQEVGSSFASARAVCLGDPQLHAGVPVSVALAGSLFSGRWAVAAARHVFDVRGYRTVLDLGSPPPSERAEGRRRAASGGPVIGVVTDVADPDDLGRVRVAMPWLSEDYVSDWCRVLTPGAGPARGLLLVPEVDDEVLVAFEQGDPRRAYVLGGLHNGHDLPPLDAGDVDESSGRVRRRGLVSRLGHRVVLDDGDDTPGVTVATGEGHVRMALDDAARTLVLECSGDVSVHADGDVGVTGRTVRVTADQELSLAAPRVTVEADSELTLSGGVVRIN